MTSYLKKHTPTNNSNKKPNADPTIAAIIMDGKDESGVMQDPDTFDIAPPPSHEKA